MAKIDLSTAVSESDIREYCTDHSLSLEMEVYNFCLQHRFVCAHAGGYIDPITGKFREYDIRAAKTTHATDITLCIECKRLGPHFPLVVHTTPRTDRENWYGGQRMDREWERQEIPNDAPFVGKFVGKSLNQVGRDATGKLQVNDSEVYEKYGQAINHAVAYASSTKHTGLKWRTAIPILVIPQHTLWEARCDQQGTLISVAQADNIDYYIDLDVPDGITIAYLKIMTVPGLKALLHEITFQASLLPNSLPSMVLGYGYDI